MCLGRSSLCYYYNKFIDINFITSNDLLFIPVTRFGNWPEGQILLTCCFRKSVTNFISDMILGIQLKNNVITVDIHKTPNGVPCGL
jgi:hypothetical protein